MACCSFFLPSKSCTDFDPYTDLESLRGEQASKSILEEARSRRDEARSTFITREDAHIAAGDQLYEAKDTVIPLQRRLHQLIQDSTLAEPTDIIDKQASINGSEQLARISPPPKQFPSPLPAISSAASPPSPSAVRNAASPPVPAAVSNTPRRYNDKSDVGLNSDQDDNLFGLDTPTLDDEFPLFVPQGETNGFDFGQASTASASPIKSMSSPIKSAKVSTPATTPTKEATPEAPVAKSSGGFPVQGMEDGTKSDPGMWLQAFNSIHISIFPINIYLGKRRCLCMPRYTFPAAIH